MAACFLSVLALVSAAAAQWTCGDGLAYSLSAGACVPCTSPATCPVPACATFPFLWDINNASARINASLAAAFPAITRNRVVDFSGWVGMMPQVTAAGVVINGGLPQLGNLTPHFAKMRTDFARVLPDTNFSGYCLLDYEYWRADWDSTPVLYQNMSINLTRSQNPSWNNSAVLAGAIASFEAAARMFVIIFVACGCLCHICVCACFFYLSLYLYYISIYLSLYRSIYIYLSIYVRVYVHACVLCACLCACADQSVPALISVRPPGHSLQLHAGHDRQRARPAAQLPLRLLCLSAQRLRDRRLCRCQCSQHAGCERPPRVAVQHVGRAVPVHLCHVGQQIKVRWADDRRLRQHDGAGGRARGWRQAHPAVHVVSLQCVPAPGAWRLDRAERRRLDDGRDRGAHGGGERACAVGRHRRDDILRAPAGEPPQHDDGSSDRQGLGFQLWSHPQDGRLDWP
eukprot:m.86677 g.86677  ORF g.86677 m.86677 type:complete len:457 (-) comp8291_c0_seq1:44-1414(-)